MPKSYFGNVLEMSWNLRVGKLLPRKSLPVAAEEIGPTSVGSLQADQHQIASTSTQAFNGAGYLSLSNIVTEILSDTNRDLFYLELDSMLSHIDKLLGTHLNILIDKDDIDKQAYHQLNDSQDKSSTVTIYIKLPPAVGKWWFTLINGRTYGRHRLTLVNEHHGRPFLPPAVASQLPPSSKGSRGKNKKMPKRGDNVEATDTLPAAPVVAAGECRTRCYGWSLSKFKPDNALVERVAEIRCQTWADSHMTQIQTARWFAALSLCGHLVLRFHRTKAPAALQNPKGSKYIDRPMLTIYCHSEEMKDKILIAAGLLTPAPVVTLTPAWTTVGIRILHPAAEPKLAKVSPVATLQLGHRQVLIARPEINFSDVKIPASMLNYSGIHIGPFDSSKTDRVTEILHTSTSWATRLVPRAVFFGPSIDWDGKDKLGCFDLYIVQHPDVKRSNEIFVNTAQFAEVVGPASSGVAADSWSIAVKFDKSVCDQKLVVKAGVGSLIPLPAIYHSTRTSPWGVDPTIGSAVVASTSSATTAGSAGTVVKGSYSGKVKASVMTAKVPTNRYDAGNEEDDSDHSDKPSDLASRMKSASSAASCTTAKGSGNSNSVKSGALTNRPDSDSEDESSDCSDDSSASGHMEVSNELDSSNSSSSPVVQAPTPPPVAANGVVKNAAALAFAEATANMSAAEKKVYRAAQKARRENDTDSMDITSSPGKRKGSNDDKTSSQTSVKKVTHGNGGTKT